MASVLRQLQAEWNALVPSARSRGIPRVRMLNAPLETIDYRRTKLEWLRSQLGSTTAFESLTFGVELEFILPDGYSHEDAARLVREAGIDCASERYNHATSRRWKVVTDGSLGSLTRGAELVSPVLRGEDGFRQLRTVCEVLTRMRAKITKKCGLHVHVGASQESIGFFKNLVTLYASAEDSINLFLSPSRRSNGYCRSVKASLSEGSLLAAQTLQSVAYAVGQNPQNVRSATRYCRLNLQSFWQHGTVEFRHHQGTVDAQKAEHWTKLCLRMCLAARAGEKRVSTVDELMAAVDATDTERAYFSSRVTYFQRSTQRFAP